MASGAQVRAPHLRALTSLRFVAAIAVVLVHFGDSIRPHLPMFGQIFISRGGNGVTFFFILSGFILTYTYGDAAERGTVKLREFWRSRFARIYPVYLLSLIIGLPLAITYAHSAGLSYSPAYLVLFVLAKLGVVHSWYPPFVNQPPWIIAGWTLAVEAFFYAIFPFLTPLLARLKNGALIPAAVGLLVLTWLPRMLYVGADPTPLQIEAAQVFPPLRLAEFALGIVLALIYRRGLLGERGTMLSWIGMALAFFGLGAVVGLDTHPIALVYTAGFALMILGFTTARGPVAKVLATPTLVLLGEASYSLYLLHDPVGILVDRVAKRVVGTGVHESMGVFVVYFLVAIGASILCYRYVEEPARMKIRGWRRPRTDLP